MVKTPFIETINDVIKESVKNYGDREAVYDQYERLTYIELWKQSMRLAEGLRKLGVKKGDRVAVCLPNWNETVVVFFATARLGAVLVPFNPTYRSNEIEYILKNAEPEVLFITERFSESMEKSRALSLVKHVISVRFNDRDCIAIQELQMNEGKSSTETAVSPEDLFCILYTSGTTGLPKGVMISHGSVSKCSTAVVNEMRCNDDDVFIVPAPLFHIFGIACNLIAAVAAGARMVLVEKYNPKLMLELIEQERVTVHQGVPTMFLKELEVPGFENYDLSSLRTGMVGAAPISPEQMKKIREKMDFHLCQSFGTTETSGGVTINGYDDDEASILKTLGKPFEGIKIKIVNEFKEELPAGSTGEIAVHSFGNMKGYYKLHEKTKEVLGEGGWYYTGDLGLMDEEGNLHYVGREKEVIIRGGLNIYPKEIEALLYEHENISEAAVIGLPDEILGEVVCAVVQLHPGKAMTEQEVKDYVSAHLAIYKTPASVIYVEHIPMTSSGKIQKVKLKKQLIPKHG
ncbi:long-chain acyl-CoA synthetase [Halobacillus dabanensis]|uniref:Long-chain acyl-CoA synthetase n=1 Tax=Halobacillus dabanensis TaxID=240302 RepID=A0A1I3WAN3_HALDA|nr:class I adenylate-forming enzyme family protein [Halobacillus dabanensis]SFK04460.1 long-chain acyl-CoA synthetase [Halobacillus dabanensis]